MEILFDLITIFKLQSKETGKKFEATVSLRGITMPEMKKALELYGRNTLYEYFLLSSQRRIIQCEHIKKNEILCFQMTQIYNVLQRGDSIIVKPQIVSTDPIYLRKLASDAVLSDLGMTLKELVDHFFTACRRQIHTVENFKSN